MTLKTAEVALNGAGLAVRHPLDPLTATEISEVTRILEDHFQWGGDLRVETIDHRRASQGYSAPLRP